jgi:hypothetical protein
MATYSTGNLIRVGVTFKNQLSRNTNPSTVTVRVKQPNGTTTDYTTPAVVQVSPGVFYYIIGPVNVVGTWYYRWIGTGFVQATAEGSFIITTAFP